MEGNTDKKPTLKTGFLQETRFLGDDWLLASSLILLAGFFTVPLIYLPRGKVFDRALQEALAAGAVTAAVTAALDDPVVRWAHRGEQVGLLVIVALMVLKPF